MSARRICMVLIGLGLAAAGLVPVAPAVAAPAPAAPIAPAGEKGPGVPLDIAPQPVSGQKTYIVGFKKGYGATQRTRFWSSRNIEPARVFDGLRAAVVNLTPAQSKALKARPEVKYVELDGVMRTNTTVASPSWGIDRLDGSATSRTDGSYTYFANGSGVNAYVIDTGIAYTNTDFGKRVKPGAYAIQDGLGTWDCNGHGTHVAGTIGGTKFGVAKKVSLIPVRVLSCNGSAPYSTIIAGMDWVVGNHSAGTPAVANLSIGGGYSSAVNDAIQRMITDGITVVVAAGNESQDACNRSPASAYNALTVGATDRSDDVAYFSNWGSCLDLFAPGVDIQSAMGGSSGSQYLSGTSMASPHVAGVAALLLSKHHSWSPAIVSSRLLAMTTRGVVTGDVEEVGSPNRLLSIAPQPTQVSPNTGRTAGKQKVSVTGVGIFDVTKVTFGSKAGTKTGAGTSGVTTKTPKHKGSGTVGVRVYSAYSRSDTSLQFTYEAPPSLSSLTPSQGSATGGSPVTITGARFHNVTTVLFGTRAGSGLRVLSATRLTVTAPVNTGKQYVRVVTAAGTSAKSKAYRFTYGTVPTVAGATPTSGWVEGGTRVAVTGTGFTSATGVTVGGVAATWAASSDTSLTLTTPRHPAGRFEIVVANTYGGSPAVAGSAFTYKAHPLPAVTGVSPNSGLTGGGNSVTISGSDFTGVQSVSFGGTPASFTVAAGQLVAVAPARGAGAVHVRVTGQYGVSPEVGADVYTYVDPTPPPPAPAVRVFAGAAINTSTCTSSRCHYVNVQTANFGGNVTCRVVDSDYGAFGVAWVQGPNETRQSPNYFGAFRITVSCDGVNGVNNNWPS